MNEPDTQHPASSEGSPREYRILIVDDEPTVLRAYRRLLEASYHVVVAESASDALAVLASGADFDLVLCDLSMPGVGGVELYESICERYPALIHKVVFCSGGALGVTVEDFLERTKCRVVYKPLAAATLRNTVADAVRANSA